MNPKLKLYLRYLFCVTKKNKYKIEKYYYYKYNNIFFIVNDKFWIGYNTRNPAIYVNKWIEFDYDVYFIFKQELKIKNIIKT